MGDNDSVEYGLKEPFDIDNDELAGISPQNVFCMGYECCLIAHSLDDETGGAFSRPIHADNASRVKRMCIRRGRKFKIEPCAEGWCSLVVADSGGEFPADLAAE
jgi:hypothetical protein